MTRHLYVVAHRAGARIFEQIGIKPELTRIHNFENPSGYLKESELVSDRAGSFTYGSGHPVAGNNDGMREHLLENFARELGTSLEKEVEGKPTTSVALIAEPHVLGVLRKFLGKSTTACLHTSVRKDLANVSDSDMQAALAEDMTHREAI